MRDRRGTMRSLKVNGQASLPAPRRVHSFARDFLFPFHTRAQFGWLALFTVLVGLAFSQSSDGPWAFMLVAWCSGSLVLTTHAPARIEAPVSMTGALRTLLEEMRFEERPDRQRWSYRFPAWLKWDNSDVLLHRKDGVVIVEGPMSTLTYIRLRLS